MAISFDSSNLLSELVGEHGLTRSEIKEQTPHALEALRSLRKISDENRQGFAQLPFQTQVAKDILKFAASVKGEYDTICVLGIGGSALGAWALDNALRGPHPVQPAFSKKNPRLVILDNVDPTFVSAALDSMDQRRTLVVVIAKSGATAETVATFLIVREWLKEKLGRKANQQIVAVTSAGRGDLAVLAEREKYRTFEIPANVGGRFSVLSPVGLVPAALIGIDIRKVLKGAAAMAELSWSKDLSGNTALRSALYQYLVWTRKNKPMQVAFPYSNRLWGTAFWFRQLWAESLGKAHLRTGETVNVGQTPIAALGTTDQHSQVQLYVEGPNDKVLSFWAVAKHKDNGRIPKARLGLDAFDYLPGQTLARLIDAERRSTAAALTSAGRPNCTYTLDRVDEEHVGAFLQLLEFQTAFVGELLGIDTFDQPGVELGKKFTFALMGRKGFETFEKQFADYEAKRKKLG
jgi:glucose-6-phosphate isomerase